ncbi:MAG: O-antigen ligase family protein [Methyloversatilis discipulorum]|uniref:O-antigen ligase family protein n=1 Tax=Methyloversatilis discipulorum TaxID=1119528 RepID=UPI0026EA0530|nr:O-antigen ligase family protein [Methyloversatilis discipulorum]MBV5285651.1 O-antigen ligase family protein [Methyloversatilis discipulorum]
MTFADFRTRIPAINSWLLAGVFFMIPVTVAPAYWLTVLILVLWLIEGRLGQKLRDLAAEPLVWAFVAYFAVFALSLLWSDDLSWGRRLLGRQYLFLLFPLYLSVAQRAHFARYVSAFLLSVTMCELLTFYNWAQLHVWPGLPDGIRVDKGADDTAPFVDRILYTPALALAGYLSAHRLLFELTSLRARLAYVALFAATVFNLLISGGRAGLVGFLALLTMLAFQRLVRRPMLATGVAAALVGGIVFGGYYGNDYFRLRVDRAFDEVVRYEELPKASVSQRIVYAANAWRVFAEHPLIGVGLGDTREAYREMNARHTPNWKPAWNPHNHYLYVLTAAGTLGAIALAAVLLLPWFLGAPADGRERVRKALPLLFIVICLFESYLMRSNTTLMFVLFTAASWCGMRGRAA